MKMWVGSEFMPSAWGRGTAGVRFPCPTVWIVTVGRSSTRFLKGNTMRYFVLALLAVALTVPAEAGKRARKCRSCRKAKSCRVVNVSRCSTTKATSGCANGSCPAPAARTIEKTKTKTITKGNHQAYLEAWCLEECRLQAQGGMGHYRGTPAGCSFCGVGTGSNSCSPHGGAPRAAVTAYGYTTRVW